MISDLFQSWTGKEIHIEKVHATAPSSLQVLGVWRTSNSLPETPQFTLKEISDYWAEVK